MNPREETRHFSRADVDWKMGVRLVDSGQRFDAVCTNMSGSGLLFHAKRAVELGKAVEVHVEPASRLIPPFMAFVEVLRCATTSKGQYLIAGAIKGIKSE